jgi:hypothetical protein
LAILLAILRASARVRSDYRRVWLHRLLPQSSSASRLTAGNGILDLEPVLDPAGAIGRVAPLRHDAFAAKRASVLKHDLGLTFVSQFHVANAEALFAENPIAALYVASVLAHRLVGANHTLIQLKRQLQTGQPQSVVAKTVSKMEELLAVSGASLVYAGYPYDPFSSMAH